MGEKERPKRLLNLAAPKQDTKETFLINPKPETKSEPMSQGLIVSRFCLMVPKKEKPCTRKEET
jgi:hypothetical protein